MQKEHNIDPNDAITKAVAQTLEIPVYSAEKHKLPEIETFVDLTGSVKTKKKA